MIWSAREGSLTQAQSVQQAAAHSLDVLTAGKGLHGIHYNVVAPHIAAHEHFHIAAWTESVVIPKPPLPLPSTWAAGQQASQSQLCLLQSYG